MFDPKEINEKSEALGALLRAKLGLRGKTLAAQFRAAGRRLPKRMHREGQLILTALEKLPHPKLAVTIDQARVNSAFTNLNHHLEAIDPADRRKGKILGWLGGVVFNLILVAGLLLAVLRWQGVI